MSEMLVGGSPEPLSVLCFGAGNTWGCVPGVEGRRYGFGERWTGILRSELGEDFYVVEEGLNGRTTVWDDPLVRGRNGRHHLEMCLETHRPLDLVILMLGTDDLRACFNASAATIAESIAAHGRCVLSSEAWPDGGSPQLLLVAPPLVSQERSEADDYRGAHRTSVELASRLRATALDLRCGFLDATNVVEPSEVDGLHLDRESHQLLGCEAARQVRSLLL